MNHSSALAFRPLTNQKVRPQTKQHKVIAGVVIADHSVDVPLLLHWM